MEVGSQSACRARAVQMQAVGSHETARDIGVWSQHAVPTSDHAWMN